MRQLMSIMDEKTLRRVVEFFKEEIPQEANSLVREDAVVYGMTDEDLNILQEIERKEISGEEEYVSMEEAMQMARVALKK
ncbi:MAG: hypothetical protein M3R08_08310 [Bacteroidota bacterium]|nr:hypothetical protein [Bacteroidota bacterium]